MSKSIRFITIALLFTMLLGMFAACGGNNKHPGNESQSVDSTLANMLSSTEQTTATDTSVPENDKNEISILFVGNSLTQDGIAYLPFLLKKYYPEIKFRFYMWYNGGKTLGEQYGYFTSDRRCSVFSVAENSMTWANSQQTMSRILATYKFDIVCMQEFFNSKSSFTAEDLIDWNNCHDYIVSNYKGGNSLEFISLFHAPLRSNVTNVYNLTEQGNKLILEETEADDIIPIGVAIKLAMETDLDKLGDAGHLSPDGIHTQEGLPCLVQTYVALLWLLDRLDIDCSITDFEIQITTQIYNDINVPGANLGSGVVTGTSADDKLAKEVAIKAYKQAKEMFDMKY